MSRWQATVLGRGDPSGPPALVGGRWRIVATPLGSRAPAARDITFLREVPTKIGSFSSADPFGDATAELDFPSLTILDDLDTAFLSWLCPDTLIDIWWVPAAKPAELGWHNWVPDPGVPDMAWWTNQLSGRADVIAPFFSYLPDGAGKPWKRDPDGQVRGAKIYEGFIASVSFSDEQGLSASCQGALLEADHYKAKPFYPPRPQTLESLIRLQFDPDERPNLHTNRCHILWPDNWSLVAPKFTGTANLFDPNVRAGAKWTGYTARNTGSWDASLTSFVANLLATMLVKPGSGAGVGDQWTLRHALAGDPNFPGGRTPYLTVRSRNAPISFSVWAGSPGVQVDLDADGTQNANVIYGTGTDIGGTTWSNSTVSQRGNRTEYIPIAYRRNLWPTHGNKLFDSSLMVRESYVQFGTGFSQTDGIDSGEQMLARDLEAGFAGTVTLTIDPRADFSRWQIRAGMTMLLKGFAGTGERGVRLHIASAEASPEDGTMALTVDTRYRDILTLHEAIARTRDPLTPAKLLQLNRNTVTIEDIQAPWNYSRGSGFITKESRFSYFHMPTTLLFPYNSWVQRFPPRTHPHYYVALHPGMAQRRDRWAGPIPILMGEKGSIRRSEFFCVDADGKMVHIPFHVSLYYVSGIGLGPNRSFMPSDARGPSPFVPYAFWNIDPSTGQPWATPKATVYHNADQSLIVGWGNREQPAGYWPALYTEVINQHADDPNYAPEPSGMLVDEGTWTWDCTTNNTNYNPGAAAGKESTDAITIYAMFYAQTQPDDPPVDGQDVPAYYRHNIRYPTPPHEGPIFFSGRLFRVEPGSDT
jgi:hypothetical protein